MALRRTTQTVAVGRDIALQLACIRLAESVATRRADRSCHRPPARRYPRHRMGDGFGRRWQVDPDSPSRRLSRGFLFLVRLGRISFGAGRAVDQYHLGDIRPVFQQADRSGGVTRLTGQLPVGRREEPAEILNGFAGQPLDPVQVDRCGTGLELSRRDDIRMIEMNCLHRRRLCNGRVSRRRNG